MIIRTFNLLQSLSINIPSQNHADNTRGRSFGSALNSPRKHDIPSWGQIQLRNDWSHNSFLGYKMDG